MKPQLVDARSEADFERGHFAGAVSLSPDAVLVWAERELRSKAQPLLVYGAQPNGRVTFHLAPGTARLAQSSKERDDAVGILKVENARLIAELADLETRFRTCQTDRATFEWLKTNPAALRLFADQIEREAKS